MPLVKLENVILRSLKMAENSGYGLIKVISDSTGWKPSAGSMYPALKKLLGRKLIKVRTEGKKKIYTITPEGKKKISKIEKTHTSVLERIKRDHRVLSKVYNLGLGEKDLGTVDNYMDDLKQGKLPFGSATDEIMELKKILMKLYAEKKVENYKDKIQSIIKKTNDELRKLK